MKYLLRVNCDILDFATKHQNIYLSGLTKSLRPWNAVPAFQRFQIAWWQVTCDTRHVTHDIWHMTQTFFSLFFFHSPSSPFLFFFVSFCPFLSVSVCFCPFLSVSVCLCLFLSVPVCFCPFLSFSVCFCQFLSAWGLFWYWCYYPHKSRDSVSPVCRIFLIFSFLNNVIDSSDPRAHENFELFSINTMYG